MSLLQAKPRSQRSKLCLIYAPASEPLSRPMSQIVSAIATWNGMNHIYHARNKENGDAEH